jgi:excinuclease ABC subunit C
MAMENAQKALHDQITLEIHHFEENLHALDDLGKLLNLCAPRLIESFDISNTAGTNTVAGMVQFLDGKPNRHNYRKFKIQPMPNMDDTAAMRQVITRRYTRLKQENLPLPDLILLDGGKGQISAALDALHSLKIHIPLAGMVKNDRHQTSGLLNEKGLPVWVEKNSPTFHLLERIQNEVHRFAITFHRQQRAKNMILSELDGIPGVGPKRRQALLRHFKSTVNIRTASLQDLQEAGLPAAIAETVHQHFQENIKHDS